MAAFKYTNVVVAGTFDRFHAGQMVLVDSAFEVGENVAVGIADASLSGGKLLSERIESLQKRKEVLKQYLSRKGLSKRTSFFRLDDIYGIARDDKTLKAIIVTRETRGNALRINRLRKQRHMPSLDIVTVPMVRGEDGRIVRSERIRFGEISREGRTFIRCFRKRKRLILPRSIRKQLRVPLGRLIGTVDGSLTKTAKKIIKEISERKPTLVVSVGDIVTSTLIDVGFMPAVQVIDLHSRREHIDVSKVKLLPHRRRATNVAGTVSIQAVRAFRASLKSYITSQKPQQIIIRGEEDLVGLPAILFAPLESIVVYGQLDAGVVLVEVTEEKKRETEKLLAKFK